MLKSDFDNSLVDKVSAFLQKYMKDNNVKSLSADECATLLAENDILTNTVGPKPGFNFRQMLRNGRDGLLNLVEGASQERPNTEWSIKRN